MVVEKVHVLDSSLASAMGGPWGEGSVSMWVRMERPTSLEREVSSVDSFKGIPPFW